METILILGIVFILLLFFPILGAMIYYRMNKGDILNINQDRIRDPIVLKSLVEVITSPVSVLECSDCFDTI